MADAEEGSSNTEDKEVTKVISVSNVEDLNWVIENQELLKKHGFMIDAGMFKQGLINNPQPSTNSSSTKQRTPPSKSKASTHDDVYVEILEQPQQRGLRFRYECESRFGGSIHGEKSVPTKKTFPTIKIHNYVGTAVIVVSCVTKDTPYKPHPHNLVGKNCRRGVCTIKVTDSNVISFPHLSIQCAKKKDIIDNLKQRQDINVDPFLSGFKHIETAMNMDRNVVRLCFQVFIPDDNGKITRIIAPVVSHPIYDKKSLNELMICRVSKSSGSAKGGDEIFLLCEKINREDIDVRFYEVAKGGVVEWEDYGIFSSYDIHRQYAIVFKTPAYKDKNITRPVEVHMQLMCKNSSDCSDPVQYVYLPDESDPDSLIKLKKRKVDHLKQFGLYSDSGSMMFPKTKQSASKLQQKDEEMDEESKFEPQKPDGMPENTKSDIQFLMEQINQNAASMSTVGDQAQKAGKSPSRRGLRSASRNSTGQQRTRSESQEKDSVVPEKVPVKMKRKASEDLKLAGKGQSPKKVDSKDSGIDIEDPMVGDLKIIETPETSASVKLPRLGAKQTQTVNEKVNDRKEFMDQNALQKQLLDQTKIARNLKSKAKNTRNMKSALLSNTQTFDITGHELPNHSAEKRKLDDRDVSKKVSVEMSSGATHQTFPSQRNGNILVPVVNYAVSATTGNVIRHRDMKLEELTSLLTQNLLTLIEEINPIIVLYCLIIHHPEVAEYWLSLQKLKSRKQRAVRFLLDLVINHKEWIPAFWDVIATDYNHCYESILSKEVPPSLHLEEQQMCIDCSRKAFNEFINNCSYIPEELLIQLLQREVLEADDVLLLNNCSNEKEKIQLLRKQIEMDKIPWIKFIESVCPLPDKEADRLKRIIDKMDFLPCKNCGRAYSIMKCLCKNENGNVSQGSKVFNLKVENISSKERTNKIAVFTLNVDESKERIVETILAKKDIINSAIGEYGIIENAWCGSVVIVLKLTNQSGEITELENVILKIVTKIFEDEDIKSHLCETELDMEVNVGDDDLQFNEDIISIKIAILSNFALLQEELDVKNFMQAFEKKGLMNKIEFSNKFCRKRLPRKQCMLHFLEYILRNGTDYLQIFFDVIEQDNFHEFLRTSLNKCVNNTRTSLSVIKRGMNSDSIMWKESSIMEEEVVKDVQKKAKKQILLSKEKGNNGKTSPEKKKEVEESTANEKSLKSKEFEKLSTKSSKTPRKIKGGKNSNARHKSNDSDTSQSVGECDSTTEIASKQKTEKEGIELKRNSAGVNSDSTPEIISKDLAEKEEKGLKRNSVGKSKVNVPIGKAILTFNDNTQVTLPVVVTEMNTNKKREIETLSHSGLAIGNTRENPEVSNEKESVDTSSGVVELQTTNKVRMDTNNKIQTGATEISMDDQTTVTNEKGVNIDDKKKAVKDNEVASEENKSITDKVIEISGKNKNTTEEEKHKENATTDNEESVVAEAVLSLSNEMETGSEKDLTELEKSIAEKQETGKTTGGTKAQLEMESAVEIQINRDSETQLTRNDITTSEKENLSSNETMEMDTNFSGNGTKTKEKEKSTINDKMESKMDDNESGTEDKTEEDIGAESPGSDIVIKEEKLSPNYSEKLLNTNKKLECSERNEVKMEVDVEFSSKNETAVEKGKASRTDDTVCTNLSEKTSFDDLNREQVSYKVKSETRDSLDDTSEVNKMKTNSDSALLLSRQSKFDSHIDSALLLGEQSLLDSQLAPNACNVRLEKLEMQLRRATNLSMKKAREHRTKTRSSSGSDIITSDEKQDGR